MTQSMKPTRLWYPVVLIDENLPTGLHSAQAWFDELGPNALQLVDDTELDWMRSYGPGDIVDFKWCEDYGLIEISIGEDGRLAATIRCPHTLDLFGRQPDPTVIAPGITADMNSFWDDDAEVYGATLEQFISAYVASFADDLPCSVDVQCAVWSDKVEFRVGPDGLTLTEILKSEGTPSC